MEKTDLAPARLHMVQAMEQGMSWDEAAKCAGLRLSQSTAYRLRQRMRKAGEQALHDGRHGHPAKLRGEVRQWLEETRPSGSSYAEPRDPNATG
jgi:transposase